MPRFNFSQTPSASPPPDWLSPQQRAVVEFATSGSGNAIVEAVAGAGKTSTLLEACVAAPGDVSFLAFNKKISQEIGRKLEAKGLDWRRAKAQTFHAAGLASLRRVSPPKIEEKKSELLAEEIGIPRHLRSFCRSLVSLGKQSALSDLSSDADVLALVDHFDLRDRIPEPEGFGRSGLRPEEELAKAIEWSRRLFARCKKAAAESGLIDFDDMLWAPLEFGTPFWQSDFVLIDEAQDTNSARRLMAERMVRPGGRVIAVGDPHQAIYGFTGADNDAMDLIAQHFQCSKLPLTVSYRCPQLIVKHARAWVSHIEAAPAAPLGELRSEDWASFLKEPLVPGEDAILCRLTRPLVALAFDLIKAGKPAYVEGRDIGQSLLTLIRKYRGVRSVDELHGKLIDYFASEYSRLLQKGDEKKAAALQDRVNTLYVFIEQCQPSDPPERVESLIEGLFQDSDGAPGQRIVLSTVHKSKGREWPRVFLLGREKWMPFPLARQDWELEQEKNLIYVAVTRAMHELVEVQVP